MVFFTKRKLNICKNYCLLANYPEAIAWLSFYAGMKFNFQNETDLKILRMFNILYNSKILATNAFKFSITTLFGASALLYNASAVSQDDTYGIGLDANHHHSYGQNIASEKRQKCSSKYQSTDECNGCLPKRYEKRKK